MTLIGEILAFGAVAYITAIIAAVIIIAAAKPAAPQIPSREYADDFAAKLSGSSRPGARPASPREPERPVLAARPTLAAHQQRRAARTPHLKIVP